MAYLADEDIMCWPSNDLSFHVHLNWLARDILLEIDPHFRPALKRSVVDTIEDEPHCGRSENLAKDVMNLVTVGQLRIITQQMLDSDRDNKITTREEFLSQFYSLCIQQIEKPL